MLDSWCFSRDRLFFFPCREQRDGFCSDLGGGPLRTPMSEWLGNLQPNLAVAEILGYRVPSSRGGLASLGGSFCQGTKVQRMA